MLESIYIGLTGLNSYSRGLQTISNNVANLNTPGFKTSTLRFADLFYSARGAGSSQSASSQFGTGVTYAQASVNFRQGDLRTSSGDLDLAIEGRGFLMLLNDGDALYTRGGQFGIDSDGFISELNLGSNLGVLSPTGVVSPFNINAKRVNAPKPTAEIKFTDNLSATAQEHVVSGIEVIDSNGGSHTWTVRFTSAFATAPGRWTVVVEDEAGEKISEGEIEFTGSTPTPGKDKISVSLTPATGAATTVTLDFSSGVTGFSGGTSSSLRMDTKDGYALGQLTRVSVDEEGQLKLEYSNGETEQVGSIALADFEDLQSLRQTGDGLFENVSGAEARVSAQGQAGVGTLKGQSIEASNVDLSQEFGQLILYQRGYQASSQVISVANEMIQQLFELRGRA